MIVSRACSNDSRCLGLAVDYRLHRLCCRTRSRGCRTHRCCPLRPGSSAVLHRTRSRGCRTHRWCRRKAHRALRCRCHLGLRVRVRALVAALLEQPRARVACLSPMCAGSAAGFAGAGVCRPAAAASSQCARRWRCFQAPPQKPSTQWC